MSSALLQGTTAWHAARRGKLTASNVGAALGLCPWTSRQTALLRGLGLDTFTGNDATKWGTANESNGVLAYSAHTGNLVDSTGLHVHPDTEWLAGSPDGLVGDEGLIEVKCPFYRRKDGSRLHKEIPMYYYLQMALCLECTSRKWCDFVSWSPDAHVVYRVTRDEDLHEILLPHYLQFFAAMSRNANAPPPMSKVVAQSIKSAVEESMQRHVDYDYWRNVDPSDLPPLEEGEIEEPPAKRQCADRGDFSRCSV
tara:strand:- start:4730 stop:5488 length:759 start_codon:yes stop_codon:yes gene_type:complete